MKTPVGAGPLPADPPTLHAANEEFRGAAPPGQMAGKRSAGWDPYEVWRTRIKPEQDKTDPGTQTF